MCRLAQAVRCARYFSRVKFVIALIDYNLQKIKKLIK